MHWSTATAFVNTKVLPRCTARTVAGEHTLSCSAVAPAHSRRSVLVGAVAAQLLCPPLAATAFDNRVVPKGKFPPTPGPKPKGVGDGPKDGQLKFCTGQPNCFTSSPLEEDAEHFYPPFEYTGMSKSDAMDTLLEVITNYKPGQGKIDEGGFKVIKSSPDYVYVQFESGKRGYVDDFEAAIVDDGKVLVRSSSRLGYLDFGVNAKRINYIAAQLNEYEGWQCATITKKTHPEYVAQNSGREKDVPQQGTWLTE